MLEREDIPKEEAAMVTFGAVKERYRTSTSHKALWSTKEMDPGQWWVLEEVGRCLKRDDLLCHSCTT
jgi:hypothetical protein